MRSLHISNNLFAAFLHALFFRVLPYWKERCQDRVYHIVLNFERPKWNSFKCDAHKTRTTQRTKFKKKTIKNSICQRKITAQINNKQCFNVYNYLHIRKLNVKRLMHDYLSVGLGIYVACLRLIFLIHSAIVYSDRVERFFFEIAFPGLLIILCLF